MGDNNGKGKNKGRFQGLRSSVTNMIGRKSRKIKQVMVPQASKQQAKSENFNPEKTMDSVVVHVDDDTGTVISDFEQMKNLDSERNNYNDAQLAKIRQNYENLTSATKTRSVNQFMSQKNYMHEKMGKPNSQLKKVLRRSVHRTRYSRSMRTTSGKYQKRFQDQFSQEPIFSAVDKDKENDEKNEDSKSVKQVAREAMELKRKQEAVDLQNKVLEKDVLIEGNLEQKKATGVGSAWKPKYGVLKASGIYYYKNKEEYQENCQPSESLLFGEVVAVDGKAATKKDSSLAYRKFQRSYIITIKTEKENAMFAVKTNSGVAMWLKHINRAFKTYLYQKGKEQAIRSFSDDWVPQAQWQELKAALNDPERLDLEQVRTTIESSLLEYLETLFVNRKNLERKQLAFKAWKALWEFKNHNNKNAQLLELGRRHSVMNFAANKNVRFSTEQSPGSKRISFVRSTEQMYTKGLRSYKSRGFGLKVGASEVQEDEVDTDLELEVQN